MLCVSACLSLQVPDGTEFQAEQQSILTAAVHDMFAMMRLAERSWGQVGPGVPVCLTHCMHAIPAHLAALAPCPSFALVMCTVLSQLPTLRQLPSAAVQPQAPMLSLQEVEAELELRGDWLPLMHLYPQNTTQEPSSLSSIVWSEADMQLQAWLKDSPVYQQAIAE